MRRHARLITLITCNALQRSVIRYYTFARRITAVPPLRAIRGVITRPRNERDKSETAGERNYVFTSRGLALSGDYFWHEREFAVDGALRKHPAFAENQQNACPSEFSRLARRREESRQGSHADRLCGGEPVQVSTVPSTLLLAILFRSSGMPPLSSRDPLSALTPCTLRVNPLDRIQRRGESSASSRRNRERIHSRARGA